MLEAMWIGVGALNLVASATSWWQLAVSQVALGLLSLAFAAVR